MKELEDFGRLLNAVYDAPLDNGRWPILSRQIADTFGTHSCALQVRTNGKTVVLGCTENFTPSLVREYQNHYHRTDDRAKGAIARGLNRAYVGTELIDNDLLTRTEHFDFLRKADIFFVVGGGVAVSTHEIGLIGVQASRNAAEFNDNDRRKMALLLPHLQRALQLRAAFRHHLIERDMAQVAMDRLAIAVILADPTAKVQFANRAAESIFQQADGLALCDGRLSTDAPATTRTLLRYIGQSCSKEYLALRSPLACAFALPRARHAPLSVMVAPLTTGDLITVSDRPMVMVLARDTQQAAGASTPEVLQALFGLTRAEARLASELVEGRGLEEIASAKGVSLNTIRSQAKSLLRKTGTQRQAELVALVHRFVIDI